jgi:hypothetical protein
VNDLLAQLSNVDDLPWWLVATLAARLWRMRSTWVRVAELLERANRRNDAWKRAAKARDARIAELLAENERERKRADALHVELQALTNVLLAST